MICDIEEFSKYDTLLLYSSSPKILKITLILRHFVLLQILFCPALGIEQSYSRLRNGHMTTASISFKEIKMDG